MRERETERKREEENDSEIVRNRERWVQVRERLVGKEGGKE